MTFIERKETREKLYSATVALPDHIVTRRGKIITLHITQLLKTVECGTVLRPISDHWTVPDIENARQHGGTDRIKGQSTTASTHLSERRGDKTSLAYWCKVIIYRLSLRASIGRLSQSVSQSLTCYV